MKNYTDNVVKLNTPPKEDVGIHQYRISDTPFDEILEMVSDEVGQALGNLLPQDWSQDDVDILIGALKQVVNEGPIDIPIDDIDIEDIGDPNVAYNKHFTANHAEYQKRKHPDDERLIPSD